MDSSCKNVITMFAATESLEEGFLILFGWHEIWILFVCVEVLRPIQPDGIMSSEISLPNHTFTGQA